MQFFAKKLLHNSVLAVRRWHFPFFWGAQEAEKSSHSLMTDKQTSMDPTRITTEVYSVYSHPWAQQRMARENADPVHGAMVFEEFGRITRQYFRHG